MQYTNMKRAYNFLQKDRLYMYIRTSICVRESDKKTHAGSLQEV